MTPYPETPDLISDLDARRIAADWHGGGGTALYAFASTGAIDTARPDHDLAREITRCTMVYGKGASFRARMRELGYLLVYVYKHGPRGPVPGWAELTW